MVHIDLDRIALHRIAPAIHVLLNLLARQHPALGLQQGPEHGKFTRRSVYQLPTLAHGLGGRVNLHVGVTKHRRRLASCAAQHGAQPGFEFIHVKRLDQIVVRTKVQARHALLNLIARGENQHWRGRIGQASHAEPDALRPQASHDVAAIAVRQAQIEQNGIKTLGAERMPGRGHVLAHIHGIAALCEVGLQTSCNAFVIFNYQYSHKQDCPTPGGNPAILPNTRLNPNIFASLRKTFAYRAHTDLIEISGCPTCNTMQHLVVQSTHLCPAGSATDVFLRPFPVCAAQCRL